MKHNFLTPTNVLFEHVITNKHGVCVCVCVCVLCVCVCVCVRPFTVKDSSAWISWDTKKQINDTLLKTLIFYAKPLHRYLRMQHPSPLTSYSIPPAY